MGTWGWGPKRSPMVGPGPLGAQVGKNCAPRPKMPRSPDSK